MRPRTPHSRCLFAIGLASGWALLAGLHGCGSVPAPTTRPRGVVTTGPSESLVTGDWNDVYAAIQTALGQNEGALLSRSESDTEQTFEFSLITDDRGTLTARRDSPAPKFNAPDPAPIPIHLSCSVGLFGNPAKERAILDATKRRIEQLAGVDWAPAP